MLESTLLFNLTFAMKRSNVLISQKTFQRRVKARLEQIKICETGEGPTDVENRNAVFAFKTLNFKMTL